MSTGYDPLASSGYSSLAGNPGTVGSGGFGSGNNGIQPLTGGGDQLTAFFRSLSNLTGTTGANLLGAGGQTTGTGLGTVGQGLADTSTGMSTLNAPIDFYKKLISGDPATMTAALGPTASLIGQQYAGVQQNATNNLPGGGYRSVVQAGIPQAQAAAVGNAAEGLQSTAAQALGQLGAEQASIGQGESGTGLGVAGVGSTQTSQGLSALVSTIQSALQRMGINLQSSGINQFATLAQGLSALI